MCKQLQQLQLASFKQQLLLLAGRGLLPPLLSLLHSGDLGEMADC